MIHPRPTVNPTANPTDNGTDNGTDKVPMMGDMMKPRPWVEKT